MQLDLPFIDRLASCRNILLAGFENIAALTAEGSFLGACALAPQMPAYQAYEAALLAVQSHGWQEPSVTTYRLWRLCAATTATIASRSPQVAACYGSRR
jgi:hypothetical protein